MPQHHRVNRARTEPLPPRRRGEIPVSAHVPSASELRREARRLRRRRFLLWTSIVSIVVLVAAIGTVGAMVVNALASPGQSEARGDSEQAAPELIDFPDDEPAAVAGAEACIAVPILSSFENAEMVANLAAGYNGQPRDINGSCVTVTASREKSGVAAESAAAGFTDLAPEQRPTVWLPDAHTWLSLARADGGGSTVPEDASSVATSDIVLAMPQPLAQAIGWDEDPPGWEDVFDAAGDADLWADLGHSEWGAFKLGKTSPVVATSGEAAMFASFGTAAGALDEISASDVSAAAVQETVREHELATSHYMATPEHFLWHARQAEQTGSAADFLSAVIVDEKSVWDYNRGITSRDGVTRTAGEPPLEKLVPIYPTDGFYAADNPAVVLTGDWVDANEADAAADFIRYTGTAQGQQIVRESGYRDLNGQLDAGIAAVANLSESPARPTAPPRSGCRRGRQRRIPRGAQARSGALPPRCFGIDGRAHLGIRDQAQRGEGRDRAGSGSLHRGRQRGPGGLRAESRGSARARGGGADGRHRSITGHVPRCPRRPAVDG